MSYWEFQWRLLLDPPPDQQISVHLPPNPGHQSRVRLPAWQEILGRQCDPSPCKARLHQQQRKSLPIQASCLRRRANLVPLLFHQLQRRHRDLRHSRLAGYRLFLRESTHSPSLGGTPRPACYATDTPVSWKISNGGCTAPPGHGGCSHVHCPGGILFCNDHPTSITVPCRLVAECVFILLCPDTMHWLLTFM